MKSESLISIVIPLLNESESLMALYERINAATAEIPHSTELLFVDDGSTDNSFEILEQLGRQDTRIKAVQFRRNHGKSAALAVGFKEASGDIIVTMDADLQDDPFEIPQLLDKLDEGYDLVSGWKKERKDSFIKRTTSRLYNRVTCMLTGLRMHDINCGLKAYRREVTDTIKVYGQLHRFLPVLAQWEGFRISEIVVKHHRRQFGKSKFGASRFIAGFLDLITVMFITRYTKRPLHLFGFLGILSFGTGLLINGYLAYERIFYQKYLTNRPLLFLGILLIIVGVQFVSIGLLGEMITENRKGNADYSIKKRLDVTGSNK